jgi:spore coat protein SA
MLWPRVTTADLRWRNVACISASLKQTLVAMGVPVTASRILYQGIPLDRFPAKPEPGALHDPVRFLYVGALLPYKGVHTILQAFGQLAERQSRARSMALTVVGDGPEPYVQRLRELAAAANAAVTFTGRVPHDALPEVYRSHDVFVFASEALEGFGLTHLEAMASGTTVIGTDRGGHAECMQDGVNTLLFREGHADELAARMARLMEEPALCERLAREARSMVERDFSLDGYVDRIEAFLEEVVRGRDVGDGGLGEASSTRAAAVSAS